MSVCHSVRPSVTSRALFYLGISWGNFPPLLYLISMLPSSPNSPGVRLNPTHGSPLPLIHLYLTNCSRHHQTILVSKIQSLVHLYSTSLQNLCLPCWEPQEMHPLCTQLVLLKSLCNQYHNLILTSKKNPSTVILSRHPLTAPSTWQTVNKLLYRNPFPPSPSKKLSARERPGVGCSYLSRWQLCFLLHRQNIQPPSVSL